MAVDRGATAELYDCLFDGCRATTPSSSGINAGVGAAIEFDQASVGVIAD